MVYLRSIRSGFGWEEAILPNSPIPKIGHLPDAKSADAIGAQLAKLPHNSKQSQFSSIRVGRSFAMRTLAHCSLVNSSTSVTV
jgi:hypothetical protein